MTLLISPATQALSRLRPDGQPGGVRLIRWTHGLINRLVMVADGLSLPAAAMLGRAMLPDPRLSVAQALAVSVVASCVFVRVLCLARCYRVERYQRLRPQMRDVARGAVPGVLAGAALIQAFLPGRLHAPGWFLAWGLCVFAGVMAQRSLARMLVILVERRALLRRRVAIIGASEAAEALVRQMSDPDFAHDYDIIGVFDDRAEERRPIMVAGLPVAGTVTDLVRYGQHHPVDVVVIAMPWESSLAIFRLAEKVQWISADVMVPFEKSGFRPHCAHLTSITGTPMLQVMDRPFKGTQGLLKVIEDMTVATIGLLAVAPVMLIAAVAIKLDSAGPVFFRQTRVGFNGRPFSIYKFRTMSVNPADDGSAGTQRDDPRITRVGHWLRRSSIDEIPQLLNVLRGEMSIVGPRPHVPNMLVGTEVYTEAVRHYAARHRIKPGITGWAQINGMRGGIHSVAKAERGVQLDLHYIANWSLRLDLSIMLRTLVIGMAGRNVF